MPTNVQIPYEVAARLKYYVYALRDPRDGHVFYVGKGKGSRINVHNFEAGKSRSRTGGTPGPAASSAGCGRRRHPGATRRARTARSQQRSCD